MSHRECDCCGSTKCNKLYRIPIDKPTRKIFMVCGRCVTYNAQKLRLWLDEQEGKVE